MVSFKRNAEGGILWWPGQALHVRGSTHIVAAMDHSGARLAKSAPRCCCLSLLTPLLLLFLLSSLSSLSSSTVPLLLLTRSRTGVLQEKPVRVKLHVSTGRVADGTITLDANPEEGGPAQLVVQAHG